MIRRFPPKIMTELSHSGKQIASITGDLPVHCKRDVASLQAFTRSTLQRLEPASALAADEFKEVFLTGATGFFGRFFLHELLSQNSRVNVHCLVRADSIEHGAKRLKTALEDADLWKDGYECRIRVIVGDTNEDRFGLAVEEFVRLCDLIDAVYHLAADLSLVSSYKNLRRSNVFSIRNILELSLTTRFKHVFFASTMAVFPEYFCDFSKEFENSRIHDQMQPDIRSMKRLFPLGFNGYPWSKIVAEQALLHACAANMPLAIFRLPVTGVAASGFMNPNDIIVRILSATNEVQASPPGVSHRNPIETVDVLAKICIAISANPQRQHTIYHCVNPQPVHHDIKHSDMGIYHKEVTYPQFKRACLARGKKSPLNGHWVLLDHLEPYWFRNSSRKDLVPVDDQAVRTDCPIPIRWTNAISIAVRSWKWIDQPQVCWPYSAPKVELKYERLLAEARLLAQSNALPFNDVYPDWLLEGMKQLIQAQSSEAVKLHNHSLGLTVLNIYYLLRENAELARERMLHPEILNEKILNPVFILGINRTGTTFLHRLLSRDPRFWTLRTYELINCVIPQGNYASVAGTQDDPRRKFSLDILDAVEIVTTTSGIHHVNVDEPEEDFKLLALAFASSIAALTYRVPEYLQWLETVDSENAYRLHYRTMQNFNWQRRLIDPSNAAKQWLFKMPFHLDQLEALTKVYSDACFIQTHRSPLEFMGSWIRMIETLRAQHYKSQDLEELGAEQLHMMSKIMHRAVDFRKSHPELEDRWIDIQFADLVEDPMGTVTRVYRKFNGTLESNALARMNRWRVRQAKKREQEVRHKYHLSDYGLTPSVVNEAFKDYLEFVEQIEFV